MLAGICGAMLVVAHMASGESTRSTPGQILLRSTAPLDDPRGVETGPGDYTVYVASAGVGDRATGYITKFVDRGPLRPRTAQRVASGFVSGRAADSAAAVGLQDVAVTPGGYVYVIVASLGRRGVRGLIGAQQQGKLLQIVAGEKHPIANVAGIT